VTGTEEPRWLDDQEQRAWRAILRAQQLIRLAMDEALAEHGLTLGEYELLSMLSEAPGERARMATIADLVVQSRSRVSHTATRLAKRGWVQRVPSAQDGRGVLLALTEQGRARLRAMAPVHVDSVRRALLDHLSPQELAEHGELMRRVVTRTRTRATQAADVV
jgi:DNA-binding MarR family transcriptional regulator